MFIFFWNIFSASVFGLWLVWECVWDGVFKLDLGLRFIFGDFLCFLMLIIMLFVNVWEDIKVNFWFMFGSERVLSIVFLSLLVKRIEFFYV